MLKLDRVGPVDDRPATDKLHHFSTLKHRDRLILADGFFLAPYPDSMYKLFSLKDD